MLLQKIQRAVIALLKNHVNMALENHRAITGSALGRILPDDDISCFILCISKLSVLCKGHQPVAQLLHMKRAMRYFADLFKKMQYQLRLCIAADLIANQRIIHHV